MCHKIFLFFEWFSLFKEKKKTFEAFLPHSLKNEKQDRWQDRFGSLVIVCQPLTWRKQLILVPLHLQLVKFTYSFMIFLTVASCSLFNSLAVFVDSLGFSIKLVCHL